MANIPARMHPFHNSTQVQNFSSGSAFFMAPSRCAPADVFSEANSTKIYHIVAVLASGPACRCLLQLLPKPNDRGMGSKSALVVSESNRVQYWGLAEARW